MTSAGTLVATLTAAADLTDARALLRGLLLRGERRMRFQSERDSRRREVIARLADAGLHTRVYESSGSADAARAAALVRLTEDVVKLDARRLMLESRGQDADRRDRQVIAHVLTGSGPAPTGFSYGHLRPHEDPILWESDAVAWCFGAGGDWRRRIIPLVDEVTRLDAI